jgi:sulfate adenylyltransferase subunit 1
MTLPPEALIAEETPGIETPENAMQEVEALLAADRSKDLLRFTTAGSVDDGKSTLIGRLLYDARGACDDHIASVTRDSGIDFAQLTDGLRAEREQGITIDVAYRYFSTPKRKFIIADTPGHEQYTRNMATGASTADVAIVLVDARKGILNQTRRHAAIASLLGIPVVIAAINKMDLMDFSEQVFLEHRSNLLELARTLEIPELVAIPVSALDGDNVVHRSDRTPWYLGPSLLESLETVPLAADRVATGFRLPVQRVVRPHQDFRGFAGQIAVGTVRPGDEVIALPSGMRARVRSIATWDGELQEARAPQSIVLTIDPEIDVSRGDMIVAADSPPRSTNSVTATVVWMHARPLCAGRAFLLRHTTQTVRAWVKEVRSRLNVERLESDPADALELNAIGEVSFETHRPLLADLYRDNRTTGSFILIDPDDNATAGAAMIRDLPTQEFSSASGAVIDVGSRSSLALELEELLLARGVLVVRTRGGGHSQLRLLALAGAMVIAESKTDDPITFYKPHGVSPIAVAAASAQQILAELRGLGIYGTGEQP